MSKIFILSVLVILIGCNQTTESNSEIEYFKRFSDYKRINIEAKDSIHSAFEYEFNNWLTGGGGDYSRYIFLNMSEFFFHTIIKSNIKFRELPVSLNKNLDTLTIDSDFGNISLKNYIDKGLVDGVIILHKGNIIYEDYPQMHWNDKHIWFSVTKILVSTSISILEDRGRINTEYPVEFYLKELENTSWEGIPIRDILDMASGLDIVEQFSGEKIPNFLLFYEDFGFPNLQAKSNDQIQFLKSIDRLRPPGEKYEYSSVNTEVLKWIVEEITQERFSDFIEKEIWQKMGAEEEGLFLINSNGDVFSAGGMSSTLRDLARFGLLFTLSGRNYNPVISDEYLNKIQNSNNKNLTTQSKFCDELKNNSYQWDEVYEDGDFLKTGNNGQGLYISPSLDLVIAYFGTINTERKINQLPYISRQIAKSGIFQTMK